MPRIHIWRAFMLSKTKISSFSRTMNELNETEDNKGIYIV
jgi:hypothetical protein